MPHFQLDEGESEFRTDYPVADIEFAKAAPARNGFDLSQSISRYLTVDSDEATVLLKL